MEGLATFSFDESTVGNNAADRGSGVIVNALSDLTAIHTDPISIGLKECLVEKIGGSLIGVVASVLPLANQGRSKKAREQPSADGIASLEVCVEGGRLSGERTNMRTHMLTSEARGDKNDFCALRRAASAVTLENNATNWFCNKANDIAPIHERASEDANERSERE